MLIKTDYEIITQLKIHLAFDDDTVKEDILKKGDIVHIVFKRKFKRIEKTGRIVRITPVLNSELKGFYSMNKVVLEMDFAEDYKSYRLKIPVEDIIDYKIIETSDSKDDNTDNIPPCKCPCKFHDNKGE